MKIPSASLEGRVALVTGAGQGIGRGIALGLATYGADVAAIDRNARGAEEAAREIEGLGRKALALHADVSDLDAVQEAVARTLESFGAIHVLVNNAGGNVGREAATGDRAPAFDRDADQALALDLHRVAVLVPVRVLFVAAGAVEITQHKPEFLGLRIPGVEQLRLSLDTHPTAPVRRHGQDRTAGVAAQALAIQQRAAPLARTDADAWEDAVAALRSAGSKEGASAQRDFELEQRLERAAAVPLQIAELGADVAITSVVLQQMMRVFPEARLVPVYPDGFSLGGEGGNLLLSFSRGTGNRVTGFEVGTSRLRGLRFETMKSMRGN